jgi:hypothetical protein
MHSHLKSPHTPKLLKDQLFFMMRVGGEVLWLKREI